MIRFDIERCPHCGHEIGFVANTCDECAAELPEDASYCPSCGHDVTDEYLECEECGREITEEDMETFNALSETEQEERVRPLREELEAREREHDTQSQTIWLPRDVKQKLELIRLNASRTIPLRALASAILTTYINENEEKLNQL